MSTDKKLTPKEKLDKALGIDSSSSIDEFLSLISTENDNAEKSIKAIDDTIKETITEVDNEIATSPQNGLSIKNIEANLNGINELISVSKDIIRQIYNVISSSDLMDPEIIASAATFIEACHSNIKEWIDLYKDRIRFVDKVKFEMLQQQHKKELIQFKHDLEMEKLKKTTVEAEVQQQSGIPYSTENILEILNDKESFDDR